jgi:hypothetical protein
MVVPTNWKTPDGGPTYRWGARLVIVRPAFRRPVTVRSSGCLRDRRYRGTLVALPPSEGQMAKKTAAKRELIDTGTDKRYVRRDEKGHFKESDDVGRSLAQDRRRPATHKAERGQGDRGDR